MSEDAPLLARPRSEKSFIRKLPRVNLSVAGIYRNPARLLSADSRGQSRGGGSFRNVSVWYHYHYF